MLKIAIIGAGAISRAHIDAYLSFPEKCEIAAVCNHHVERAEKLIAEKNLSGAKAFDSLESALKELHIDAASVCLPPAEHAKQTIFALEHGVHVICEKPMANSLEECDAMIAAAEKNNVKLAVVCQLRCASRTQRIKQLLASGEFGRPLYTKVDSMWWRGSNYHKMFWRGTWASEGGGVLSGQAIHHLDLTLYLLGMPKAVTAYMNNVGHDNSECEDIISVSLDYGDYAAQFNASLVAHGERQRIDIYTEGGMMSIPWEFDASRQMDNGFPEKDGEGMERLNAAFNAIPEMKYENHVGQIYNFLCAIEGEGEMIADGNEGRNVIEVITAAYLSAIEHKSVSLPLDKSCRLYTLEGKINNLPHFYEKHESVASLGDGAITFAK